LRVLAKINKIKMRPKFEEKRGKEIWGEMRPKYSSSGDNLQK